MFLQEQIKDIIIITSPRRWPALAVTPAVVCVYCAVVCVYCTFITAVPMLGGDRVSSREEERAKCNTSRAPWLHHGELMCVCLLLQYLLQSCSSGGRGKVDDMCCERRRAEANCNLIRRHKRKSNSIYIQTHSSCLGWSRTTCQYHDKAVLYCCSMCVFITAGPIIKLCAGKGGGQ